MRHSVPLKWRSPATLIHGWSGISGPREMVLSSLNMTLACQQDLPASWASIKWKMFLISIFQDLSGLHEFTQLTLVLWV